MICSVDDLIAYDDDIAVLAGFELRSYSERKEYTGLLIDKDKEKFKIFIEVIKDFHSRGIIEEPPKQLLQINTDKFLNEDIVEYI